jgi:hypothetical protein
MVQAWERCLNQARPARASAPFVTAETRATAMDRFSGPEVSAVRVLPVLAHDQTEGTDGVAIAGAVDHV